MRSGRMFGDNSPWVSGFEHLESGGAWCLCSRLYFKNVCTSIALIYRDNVYPWNKEDFFFFIFGFVLIWFGGGGDFYCQYNKEMSLSISLKHSSNVSLSIRKDSGSLSIGLLLYSMTQDNAGATIALRDLVLRKTAQVLAPQLLWWLWVVNSPLSLTQVSCVFCQHSRNCVNLRPFPVLDKEKFRYKI